ncbi:MAG: Protein TolQ [Myxococcota bacterium]|nr:Protein TolQ [Myxococcota bacterium]
MITKLSLGFTLLGAEWVMWVLIALSFVSILLMVERIMVFRNADRGVAALQPELEKLLRDGRFSEAGERAASSNTVHGRIFAAAAERHREGAQTVEEVVAGSAARERLNLEKNLTFLGTVGSNAPFIGLFGTVLGIIKAFDDLSKNTTAGSAAVMAGIAEALVATAIGLLVAIPAVIAFNYFQRRLKTIMNSADALCRFMIARLKAEREQ